LQILKDQRHSLFEYWIRQAVSQLPASPSIADFYARHLWEEHRLQELANADWINEVTTETDYSIFGRPDFSVEATRARTLRQAAKTLLNPDRGLIESLADGIASIDTEVHLCEQGKSLVMLCINEGLPEFLPKFYSRICSRCINERIGEASQALGGLLAAAHLVRGNYPEAVSYSEEVLARDPQSDEELVLWSYYWSLDEVGRTEEAISVAKRLYAKDPDRPHLAHNLGLMNQQFGRLGEALYYYSRQTANAPHLFAQSALTFLFLLHKQWEEAKQSCDYWSSLMRDPTIARNFYGQNQEFSGSLTQEDSEGQGIDEPADGPEVQSSDSWMSLIGPRIEQSQRAFEELMAFAKDNVDSPTLVLDLIEKNNSFGDYKIGAQTRIKPEPYSFWQILEQSHHGEGPETAQAKFLLHLEQSGDFSVFHASLNGAIPQFDHLTWEAIASLYEGERRLISEMRMLDYSPVAISFAKGVEICLKQNVFVPFMNTCNATVTISQQIQLALRDKNSQGTSLYRFLDKGQHLELGSMAHLLALCNGRTAEREFLIGKLRDFIRFKLNCPGLLENEIVESIRLIAKEFRNPGAHSAILTRDNAQDCRRLCVNILGVLPILLDP
jgi:tetratricopeptide (TPR) repeat protein